MQTNNVVAYCRFSSDNQRTESIDAQIRAIKEYCKKNRYILTHIYRDEALSGTSDKRNQFQQMIADSKDGLFDAVIVHKLDRFARNRYDSAIYKKKLKDNGVIVLSVLENLDDTPEAVILESVLEGMNEYYSKNLAREVRKGLNENALKAKHNGGTPPLGYDVDDDKNYIINEKEANAVQLIFDLYLKNYGYGLIADKLNEDGYVTKYGFKFSKNSIRDILLNEKYRGCYVWNKRKSKKTGNRVYKDNKEIIKIEGAMPRIISDEVFFQVQDKLGKRTKPRKKTNFEYILTGYLECGYCGYSYCGGQATRSKKDGTYIPRYTCTNRKKKLGCKNKSIRADYLENAVIDCIKNTFLTDEAIKMLSKKIKEYIDINNEKCNDSKINDLKHEINKLKRQQEKILDLYLEEKININILNQKSDKIDKQINIINNQLAEEMAIQKLEYDEKDIISFLQDMRNSLNENKNKNKRMLVEAFIYKILIYDNQVVVKLRCDNAFKKCSKVGGGEGNRTPVQA